MQPVVECVPNISEGRDMEAIEDIVSRAARVANCRVAHVAPDRDHNRTVITLLGGPAAIVSAAVALAVRAAERIDLRRHSGAHPRMGATDVLPFVPLREYSLAECADLSRRVGWTLWVQARIPVFLYGAAATAPLRENLARIRQGGFEGMPEKIKSTEWRPDFGDTVHPTAGVTACGARRPLVAFNVNLNTDDIKGARVIAKSVRQSDGGLLALKALGMSMTSRGAAQVSMNLCDTEKTSLPRAFEAVRDEAFRLGVRVTSSEIVGMIPFGAWRDCEGYDLQLEGFDPNRQVLGF